MKQARKVRTNSKLNESDRSFNVIRIEPQQMYAFKERFLAHLEIMRLDHWIKNIFVLPGVVLGYSLMGTSSLPTVLWHTLWGLLGIGLVASGNYVINEVLDAPYDKFHPTKFQRPVPSGKVNIPLAYVEWILLIIIGVAMGALISKAVAITYSALAIMGVIYNVRPFRTKDKPYLDALTESINNPIRLLAGWFFVGSGAITPLSVLLSYWMIGAYLMTLKRFAELREFKSSVEAAQYRPSLKYYTQNSLLLASVFYASTSMLFMGGVIFRYRLELVLAYPFLGALVTSYLHISLKPDGSAHAPEKLYKEKILLVCVAACLVAMTFLMLVDLPWLREFFSSTINH